MVYACFWGGVSVINEWGLIKQGASESVEAVEFSFMTAEEVRKHSVKQINNPILLDALEEPVPGGLYDPALGPLHDKV